MTDSWIEIQKNVYGFVVYVFWVMINGIDVETQTTHVMFYVVVIFYDWRGDNNNILDKDIRDIFFYFLDQWPCVCRNNRLRNRSCKRIQLKRHLLALSQSFFFSVFHHEFVLFFHPFSVFYCLLLSPFFLLYSCLLYTSDAADE